MAKPNLLSPLIWKCLPDFLSEISLTLSEESVNSYRSDISAFIRWLQENNISKADCIKTSHITRYLENRKLQGRKDKSISRYFSTIKAFFKFLKRSKLISEDPMQDLNCPRVVVKALSIPSFLDVMRIINNIDFTDEYGSRDLAIFELLYSSGLRVTELCELELKHFDAERKQIVVSCGKGNKTRTVPINDQALQSITSYILKRPEGEGYLFLNTLGGSMRRDMISKMIRTRSESANVMNVTTHTLRHACATHLLEQGADLRTIQELLGHSSISSTQRYTHLTSIQVQEKFNSVQRKRHA